ALERTWTGEFPFAFVPLLLAPAVWTSTEDDFDAVRARLKADWKRAEILDDEAIETFLEHLYRDQSLRWRQDAALGFVNDASHSHRNPTSSGGKKWLEQGGFDRFAAFMRTVVEKPA